MPRKSPNVFTTNFINLSKRRKNDFLGVHVDRGHADDAKFKSSLFPRIFEKKSQLSVVYKWTKVCEDENGSFSRLILTTIHCVSHLRKLAGDKTCRPHSDCCCNSISSTSKVLAIPPRSWSDCYCWPKEIEFTRRSVAGLRHRSISMSDFALNRKNTFSGGRKSRETIQLSTKFGKSFVRLTFAS